MARGDEFKTASKATTAVKHLEVAAPFKKPAMSTNLAQPQKPQKEKKDYGAWGPIFKDKQSFVDMHLC
ncbi:hypothetical protein EVAR_21856_1 [Eumeta japonica]|uniref:Uncharacterized protein n=1 Tax=Eumeta variegata TaxID=151549 RepID=A0A4C1V8V7_EUMVA|nr:hypothetical protein EVAR_21856_1 [Eumeta japonica]